ncbi:uncharacterized protein B0H18DRAFT_1087258 [Fomitopsis serialis]|uniref:uncharacterized protein n=1 Tax=Fomitopsis serialis TaxID=139415 RepID=UPI00200752B7|nr:uncharacterized protein B0H18DRAFT_1087258 [Neoantrodia serialis]KAH9916799.1 hypothetical protein B0H18DRAFT_1087258 [Neoantrodia serialis]
MHDIVLPRNLQLERQSATTTIRILAKAFAAGWPLVLPCATYFLAGATGHLVTTGVVWCKDCTSRVFRCPLFSRYATLEEEARYWTSSREAQRSLGASNANSTPPDVPLVRYYVPKLLPPYRDKKDSSSLDDADEYRISAKTFCKWHRMVFRGPLHPTLKQAGKLMKNYSGRDRKEMRRIARMLTDEEVFLHKIPWTPVYRDIWRRWLETKGPDIMISFE